MAGEHEGNQEDPVVANIGEDHWEAEQDLFLGLLHIQHSLPPVRPPFSAITATLNLQRRAISTGATVTSLKYFCISIRIYLFST